MAKRFCVVDLEAWGLHVLNDPPLEIGLKLVDTEWNTIDEISSVIWEEHWYDALYEELAKKPDHVVYKMHTESGLFAEAKQHGGPIHDVEEMLLEWAVKNNISPETDYICGSSVKYDYYQMFFNMNDLNKLFHYRVIDTSSIKVITELWYPNMAARLKKETHPRKLHRVEPDIQDTIEELQWYFTHVLPETDEETVSNA